MELGEKVDLVAVISAAPRNGRLVDRIYRAGRIEIAETYRKAIIEYRPRWFPGRLALLWPVEEPRPIEEPEDVAMGWSRVAPHVTVRHIPGNHSTSLTDHVRDAADCLRDCISEIQQVGFAVK
jgi:hypothetical protein